MSGRFLENDIWIAAVAAQHGLTVVSRDDHFTDLAGVPVTSSTPSGSSASRLDGVVHEHQLEIAFHAVAHKHVPLMVLSFHLGQEKSRQFVRLFGVHVTTLMPQSSPHSAYPGNPPTRRICVLQRP